MTPTPAAPAAPAGAVAHVAGRTGAVSVVRSTRGGFDVLAGDVTLTGIPSATLAAYADEVLEHLEQRTGERTSVPWTEPFPPSAVLEHNGVQLRLLDHGDLVTVMAFVGADKGGAGTGVHLADVRAFALALQDLAAPDHAEGRRP